MSLVNGIFSEKMIFSLGWTFINSLWQGGFICIVNWIILLMLSKQSARLRYIVSTVSLFAVLAFAVWTFFVLSDYYNVYFAVANSVSGSALKNPAHNGVFDLFLLQVIPLNTSEYFGYFNNHLPLILTVWFWGVLFLSLKQLGGFALTQRLGHYRTVAPDNNWQKRIEYFADRLGIKKSVKLLESAIVKVPTVIGFLKPVVLLPVGLLSGIPANQVEAIFIHELAHIKRRDYLINILQNILEVIFFFNPFVWLISSIVRSEREHCCDDMAVQVSGDTISFIKALANIGAIDSTKSDYAMALSLNKNQLLKRIDRIMKMKNHKSNYSRLFISALVLILGLTFLGTSAMGGYGYESSKLTVAIPDTGLSKTKQQAQSKLKELPPPPKLEELKMKKEQMIIDLKKKYETATDDETRKNIGKKIQKLQTSDDLTPPPPPQTEMLQKKQFIEQLKKKYEATDDENLKKKIAEKIKDIQNDGAVSPPPDLMKKKQIIEELKKKYEATNDEELKQKIAEKIKDIQKGENPPPSKKK